MIEFVDGDYIAGVWVAPLPEAVGRPGNFLATLYWRTGVWHLIYRFRYFVDDKIFDSADERSWYHASMPQAAMTKEEGHRLAETLADLVQSMRGRFYPVEGGPERFQEVAMEIADFSVRMHDDTRT